MQSQTFNFIMITHNSGMAHTTNVFQKQLFSSEILTAKKNVCIYEIIVKGADLESI